MSILKDYVDYGVAEGMTARLKLLSAASYLRNAGDHIQANEWPQANTDMHNAADSIGDAAFSAFYGGTMGMSFLKRWRSAFYWIDDNWPEAVEVNMDAILNAMLASDFDQLQKFIGIVDAYRVALWNAPFNVDFYAALARGFQIWPQY